MENKVVITQELSDSMESAGSTLLGAVIVGGLAIVGYGLLALVGAVTEVDDPEDGVDETVE